MLFPFIILLWISIPGLIAQSAALLPDGQASSYVLGPDDQIVIHGIDIDEIAEKPVQVGQDGQISLPLLGTIRVGGCTVRELEAALRLKLSAIIRSPQVSITVTEFRSQPVSVLGAVNNAGVHQLRGSKTLTEVLSMAGGVRQDAGYRVNVVRKAEWGKIPLSNAHSVESGKYSVAEINLKHILAASSPDDNIRICPEDVITVPRGELVYVVGEVTKPGGFVLNDNESVTVLQALALAGGLRAGASPKAARVLRPIDGGKRKTEVAVDLKKILSGRSPDTPLKADDILFVPVNVPKLAGLRAAEAAINIGTGLVIWRQ